MLVQSHHITLTQHIKLQTTNFDVCDIESNTTTQSTGTLDGVPSNQIPN